MFLLWQSDRRLSDRRRPGERSQEAAIIKAHTSPTPGTMVWGAIGYGNSTDMVLAEGRRNSRQYVARIVNPVVIPFMNKVMQPSHTAIHIRNFLENVRILDWPPRSHDAILG